MNKNDCWQKALRLHQTGKMDEAVMLCEQELCATNSPECQRYLGFVYLKNDLLEKSLSLFTLAVEAGDVKSIIGMASVYFKMKDFDNAVIYYKNALDSGDYKSCYWLGSLYEKGLGVTENREKAIKYFQLGSEYGYLMCDRSLIYLEYMHGSFWIKICSKFKLLKLMWETFRIAINDGHDERLSEIKLKGFNLDLDEYKNKS